MIHWNTYHWLRGYAIFSLPAPSNPCDCHTFNFTSEWSSAPWTGLRVPRAETYLSSKWELNLMERISESGENIQPSGMEPRTQKKRHIEPVITQCSSVPFTYHTLCAWKETKKVRCNIHQRSRTRPEDLCFVQVGTFFRLRSVPKKLAAAVAVVCETMQSKTECALRQRKKSMNSTSFSAFGPFAAFPFAARLHTPFPVSNVWNDEYEYICVCVCMCAQYW